MADVNVFDVASTVVTVDNFQIMDFSTGDPVTAQKDADDVQADQDIMGNAFLVKQHNGTGTATLRILPGTPSYKKMMTLWNSKKVFPFVLDTAEETISATKATLMRSPSTAITGGAPVREFQVKCLDYKHVAK
ncbi:hypothetical protein ACRYI5_01265 [Furfurilactobacillus sp. WILCCON 0119]